MKICLYCIKKLAEQIITIIFVCQCGWVLPFEQQPARAEVIELPDISNRGTHCVNKTASTAVGDRYSATQDGRCGVIGGEVGS